MPLTEFSLSSGNSLLASLSRADREHVIGACHNVELIWGKEVYSAGEEIRHVYFPTDSYISLVAPADASESLEVGMVGNEGVFGVTVLLGVKTSSLTGVVQGGGHALRMSAARLIKIANERESFKRVLNRYMYVLIAQVVQTAACTRFHSLEARMVRWVLMTHDRAHRNTFDLTHRFLAYMLGVRRAGVTEAAGRLRAKGLINYSNGKLTVLNRPALEAISCPCYASLRVTYLQYLRGAQPSMRDPGG